MNDEHRIRTEVAARVRAILDAMKIAPNADYEGKTVPEIRATAVASVKGSDAIAGRSVDAIEGVFDQLIESGGSTGWTRTAPRPH